MTILEQVTAAAIDMKSKIALDKRHRYTRVSDGKVLTSVTAITKNAMPKDWLPWWAAKEAVKFLGYSELDPLPRTLEIRERIINSSIEDYLLLLDEAKHAHDRRSKVALAAGTDCHTWAETYVKAKIAGTVVPEMPAELRRPLTQFVEWAESNVEAWVLSEASVFESDAEYAGTLDAVALLKDGRLVLIDFKLAKHISPDYYLQAAGYAIPFEKYGIRFDDRIIIRLPKVEEDNLEVERVASSYEEDKVVFMAAFMLQKWAKRAEKKN